MIEKRLFDGDNLQQMKPSRFTSYYDLTRKNNFLRLSSGTSSKICNLDKREFLCFILVKPRWNVIKDDYKKIYIYAR